MTLAVSGCHKRRLEHWCHCGLQMIEECEVELKLLKKWMTHVQNVTRHQFIPYLIPRMACRGEILVTELCSRSSYGSHPKTCKRNPWTEWICAGQRYRACFPRYARSAQNLLYELSSSTRHISIDMSSCWHSTYSQPVVNCQLSDCWENSKSKLTDAKQLPRKGIDPDMKDCKWDRNV